MNDVKNVSRDSVRAAILNAKNTSRKSKLIDFFGQSIEIRQPTIGQLNAMNDDSKTPTIITLLLEYCYIPGEKNTKVFEPADKDELLNIPTGEWLHNFNKAIEELTGVNVEVAEKN